MGHPIDGWNECVFSLFEHDVLLHETSILHRDIEFLKGVGPAWGALLRKELNVQTIGDLLFLFPFRHIDKTQFQYIKDIRSDGQVVQLRGTLVEKSVVKGKSGQRLNALFKDQSGFVELVWFRGIRWIEPSLEEGKSYVVYGRVNIFKGKKSIPHPEIEAVGTSNAAHQVRFDPVYHSTEKLDAKGLRSRPRRKLIERILDSITARDLIENLPDYLRQKLQLCSRFESIQWIHFPPDQSALDAAVKRIKFEELLFLQLRLLRGKIVRLQKSKGAPFSVIGPSFNRFYQERLPFELTSAQKRVLKEIRNDVGSGKQMNRLLQGDVGSGKTVVALMTMLMAVDNGYQACLMAPTEILAQQHYQTLQDFLRGLKIRMAFLSGNITGNKRKEILKLLASGDLHLIVGTHALIEESVRFHKLGLAITDEQHRFGVAQRAKLWTKNTVTPPHVLVMTATPIPRTLAMTLYGDLDVSVIDGLPPGRKDVRTVHRSESKRAEVIAFVHREIAAGQQVYVVFPIIEESAKLDLQNLQAGYDQLLQFFPKPAFQIAVVHGRMKAKDKEGEMQRFVRGKAQIMVATTVIEVGVNVPNATVMIIENAERFGLSQLHQLRGRVGRGADQSHCILMTSYKLTKEARERIQTMCRTNNGFEIAEADMRLRGPGDIEGTQQSGVMDFKLVNLVTDGAILSTARHIAEKILEKDAGLIHPQNRTLQSYLHYLQNQAPTWSRIS